jgi:hypothetical protein
MRSLCDMCSVVPKIERDLIADLINKTDNLDFPKFPSAHFPYSERFLFLDITA